MSDKQPISEISSSKLIIRIGILLGSKTTQELGSLLTELSSRGIIISMPLSSVSKMKDNYKKFVDKQKGGG